ncbi:endonuclease NucS domain-containing protein [Zhongshania sp. BJYM1]|uniref:endonuclease NucS domain-containing protein n=1 Tax=Zhongshania aquatica TaxID=2965069 RepID=UPI0022B3DB81|nr:endonuclease NucS domain-containing protein [Marortus sp. BJYM1]
MAIEQGIWRIDGGGNVASQRLRTAKLDDENQLEELIVRDVSIINADWLLIGRQVRTSFDKRIDLLALDANGSVIIIELKRDKTPRDVVAQAIDYASWIDTVDDAQLVDCYLDFALRHGLPESSLDAAFFAKFSLPLADVNLNDSHQMVIVASELDASTERIITYLNDRHGVGINAVFFSAFIDGDKRYLSRAWMIDPKETQQLASTRGAREPWNGEFYVSFGEGERRSWDDALRYGFISAGGGGWYTNTLNMLSEGDRVWVNIPKTGYVGVGVVTGDRVSLDDFLVEKENLRGLETQVNYCSFDHDSIDAAEYFVPIKWEHTVPIAQAFSEVGLFGNQNSVCKPTTPKWSHTVNRLKQTWSIT